MTLGAQCLEFRPHTVVSGLVPEGILNRVDSWSGPSDARRASQRVACRAISPYLCASSTCRAPTRPLLHTLYSLPTISVMIVGHIYE